MKRILKLVAAFVALILTADSYAQNFTNKGKEFWVGYGHHQYMETSCDGLTQGDNTQNMVLYLSNSESAVATVTVTIDNSVKLGFPNGWRKVYTINPNTVIQSDIIPKGSTNSVASGSDPNFDARLFSNFGGEELFVKRGIHIVSDVAIVAYAHIYGGVSSGATMLLPIETWGYSYTSINSEQRDADRSFSWMYVIAKDDNTRVRITPSATSRLGKPAGVPFTIDMQKGQIYQLIGSADCATGNGPELTGTTIKSIVGADGVCHPVGVYSGSSRTGGETFTCGTGSGRDNDMQQCFPEVAWGKRYLTTPFSKASSGTSLQADQFMTSVYKIVVKDPATVVKKNGVVMTGLIGGKYYKYSSAVGDYIEANKPVMIAQYMSGTGTCNGGQGDPEMIYISPIEQAINNIGFFRNTKEAIVANYLTLVVPTTGLPSLRINNSQLFDYTYPHPQNALAGTSYTVVVKGWAAAQSQVIVKCDSAFNAITYGLGGAESYGYNAGTYLKNLNAQGELYNTPDTANKPRPFTCTGTPLNLTALIAYQPTSINWKMSTLSTVMSPSADIFQSNPTPIGTVVIGSATYYRYQVPGGPYLFNTAGSYDLPFVCTSTDIDNCSLQETLQVTVEVKPRPSSNFTFNHSGCRTDSVSFIGPNSTGTYTANGWNWNFGDATRDSIKNPKKIYAATGTYNVSLVVTSTEGCLSDTTTKPVTINPARAASIFIAAPDTCQGSTLSFSDTTSVTSGTFYWDFGTGTPVTTNSNTPQTYSYPLPGTYIVKHVIFPTGNCVSDTIFRTVTIYPKPVKPVVVRPATYCQNATATPLNATALPGDTLIWYSAFPLTNGSRTAPTPATTTAGTFNYYVIQKTAQGCISDTAIIPVTITPAIAGNTITANQTVCSGSPAATLTGAQPTGGTGAYTYQWQQSTDGGAIWTNITGETALSYSPGILSTGVIKFRLVVTSGLCSSVSNTVDITVETNLSSYDIAASQTICQGSTPALLTGQSPTGGTGSYSYQWQVSPDGVSWTAIAGATTRDYQPGVLNAKTYYRRITSGGNCPAISSVVIITTNPTANGAITGPASICQYNTASVSFTATAGTAPYSIQLLLTAPGGATSTITQSIPTNGPASIPVLPINSAPGIYTIALQSVSDNGNCIRTTGLNTVSIVVTATPAVTFNPAAPIICSGNSITIMASGATSYSWSPAGGLNTTTGATVTANPAATAIYTVSGTTAGCNGTGTVTVTVNPIPGKPSVVRPVAYCQNAAAVLLSATALPGHTLVWYNAFPLTAGTPAAPTPSTATAGTVTYYVTQVNTATNCSSDTSRIDVTITPVIANNVISGNQTICSGTAAVAINGSVNSLTGGINSYLTQWQASTDGGATWNNIASATNIDYSPGILATGVTSFRRVVTSGLCTSISNTVTITVQTSLNNYNISAAQTVCEGIVPALLDGQTPTGGTGTYTYQWESSPDGTAWTPIAGATIEDYQPPALTANRYYRRTASGGICPAISSTVLITVNPTPNATITAPAGICDYQTGSVSFTASAGTAPYTIALTITAPGGGTSTISQTINSAGPATINVLPLNSAPGTYTIQLASVTDSKSCVRSTGLSSVTIVVTAKPNVTVASTSASICEGTSATLTATGAANYVWSPSTGLSAVTGNSVTASPVTNTTYQVIGATSGCDDTATVSITVVARPAKPIVVRPVDYCIGATASALTATALTGNTLTWYNNSSLTGGTTSAPTPSTATAGTVYYYVTQTNSNNCISDTSSISVTIHPLPSVDFDLPAGVCMPNGTATFTNKTTIADGSALTYAWTLGDGSPVEATKDVNHIYATSGSYTVTLTVTSAYSCVSTKTKTFSAFFEKPIADFDVNPTVLCQGQENFFTDNSDPRGSTITKWNWIFGDGKTDAVKSPVHRYTAPGAYKINLVVTTAIGCVSDTFSKDVVVYLQPRIDAGPSFVVPDGTVVQLKGTANDTSGVSLYWSPTIGLSNPTTLRPFVTVTRNQTYTLTAIGQGNCTAIDTMTVRILKQVEVPNAFSPNGDGFNDVWLIPNLADYPGAKVEVFNRWGQQVYLSYGYNRPWDGTYTGKSLPLATYYYIITLNNGFKPVTGSVTIIK